LRIAKYQSTAIAGEKTYGTFTERIVLILRFVVLDISGLCG
jgi:hypothetical protein